MIIYIKYVSVEKKLDDSGPMENTNRAAGSLPQTPTNIRKLSFGRPKSAPKLSETYQNHTLMVNPNCNRGMFMEYIIQKCKLNDDKKYYDLCDEKGNVMNLLMLKPHENVSNNVVYRQTYYLFSVERVINKREGSSPIKISPLLVPHTKVYKDIKKKIFDKLKMNRQFLKMLLPVRRTADGNDDEQGRHGPGRLRHASASPSTPHHHRSTIRRRGSTSMPHAKSRSLSATSSYFDRLLNTVDSHDDILPTVDSSGGDAKMIVHVDRRPIVVKERLLGRPATTESHSQSTRQTVAFPDLSVISHPMKSNLRPSSGPKLDMSSDTVREERRKSIRNRKISVSIRIPEDMGSISVDKNDYNKTTDQAIDSDTVRPYKIQEDNIYEVSITNNMQKLMKEKDVNYETNSEKVKSDTSVKNSNEVRKTNVILMKSQNRRKENKIISILEQPIKVARGELDSGVSHKTDRQSSLSSIRKKEHGNTIISENIITQNMAHLKIESKLEQQKEMNKEVVNIFQRPIQENHYSPSPSYPKKTADNMSACDLKMVSNNKIKTKRKQKETLHNLTKITEDSRFFPIHSQPMENIVQLENCRKKMNTKYETDQKHKTDKENISTSSESNISRSNLAPTPVPSLNSKLSSKKSFVSSGDLSKRKKINSKEIKKDIEEMFELNQ